jgi:pimeloyl-ACP methyl ester carboxylesterase
VVAGYDTREAPLYPPEGLFVDATAIYDRPAGHPRFSIRYATTDVMLKGRTYRLAINPTGAGDHLKLRAKAFAKSGFEGMIRPSSTLRKPQIYLLDPYDPNKIPILMVHGLQSTPVAFATLVNALRSDPEIRAKYQIWQFYYASGTPVLANAAELRDSLAETAHTLDPKDRDAATKRIVVLGHSMGGVISHTLVSSSQGRVWASVFRVPPAQLKGDPEAVRELVHVLYFRRNPRVARVIFMAAPHRGSPMADSFVGMLGNLLTRVPPLPELGLSQASAGEARAQIFRQLYKRARPGPHLSHARPIHFFGEEEFLDRLSLLEPLSAEEKAKLRAKIVKRHFKVGEELLVQGLKLESVQFVSYGVAQGARQVADGRVLKSVRLGPGDFFGEVSLLTGMAAGSTLTAITPGVLLGFCSEDLKPILASRPELVESVGYAVARKQHLFTMLDHAAIQEMPIEQHDLLSRIRSFFNLNV